MVPPPSIRSTLNTGDRYLPLACAVFVACVFGAGSASACQASPDPMIDDPCAPPAPALPKGAKVSHLEVRGHSGFGALILEDGTLVSLDFASGEIAIRAADGADIRVHRDQLPYEARTQFIQLASLAANSPGFSFEAGTGHPPSRPDSPVFVPRWGYPLRQSMFSFGGAVFPEEWRGR